MNISHITSIEVWVCLETDFNEFLKTQMFRNQVWTFREQNNIITKIWDKEHTLKLQDYEV